MRLITSTVRALTAAPAAFDKVHFDERLPGFGLRVRESGVHTWMIKYRFGGLTRRMVLGSLSELDPGKAFDAARDLLAQVRLGRDPVIEKAKAQAEATETFMAILPRFLDHQRANLRLNTYNGVERHLTSHAKSLHGLPVAAITRRTIAEMLGAIEQSSGPVARNRVRASLSGYFTWLSCEGYVDANPVALTVKLAETARERVPSDDDITNIWRALADDQYGAVVKLILLTGTRREEIGQLRWSEIDLDQATITLGSKRTKNGEAHTIPLSAPAAEILRAQPRRTNADGTLRDHVFGQRPGKGYQDWSVNKARLDARLGDLVEPWVLHDLRRSISTALHDQFNVAPHLVEAILGHIGGHRAGVAGVYNKASYIDERRRVLERWGAHVVEIATGKPVKARVIPLRG